MLKWNAQKHPPSNDSGLEVFADISTHYVTDIQCAVDANVFDNNIVEQKVNNSNPLSNSMSHYTYKVCLTMYWQFNIIFCLYFTSF